MIHSSRKYVKTRKIHKCVECGNSIPKGVVALSIHHAVFSDSEVATQWEDLHVCAEHQPQEDKP